MTDDRKPSWLSRLLGGAAQPPAQPASRPPYAEARVHTDAARCVQCGVCSYNCPVGISIRDFSRLGNAVLDPRCVQCGQCIEACPRGTLRWGRSQLRSVPTTEEPPG